MFSTIAALAGVNVDQINDSISFEKLLGEEQESELLIQYSERSTDSGEEWTLSDGIYKLIESSAGAQQLYQLSNDPFEDTDLVESGTAPGDVVEDLLFLVDQIRQ
jgi:arylsulfatase B